MNVTTADNRARALKALNTVATELKDCGSDAAVCERTVAAAERILEFDLCVINLESDGMLPIAALSAGVPPEGATPMSVEEGLVGKAYREGRTILVEDAQEHPEANPQGPYRSAMTIPIGDYGVFQAVSREVGDFDESDRELAELLVAHCHSALERLDREAEIREYVRTLEQQNARLEEFANVVSHDLRNPLSVLEGYLELARETGEPEHFDRCAEAIGRMNRLIDDLLTLAQQGETVGEHEIVDLRELAERCWRNVDTGDARLSVRTAAAVEGDPDRLQQLLENLFRNAIEHGLGTDPKRADEPADSGVGDLGDLTVTVGTLPDGDGFFVADDGVGIAEEDHGRVLEPGYSTRSGGTGFGLGIVAEIAEAHGWVIRVVESESGGARFEFAGVTMEGDAGTVSNGGSAS